MLPDLPAIVFEIPAFGRCTCPECKRLDRRFPDEGWQLALFPYVISLKPVRITR